MSKYLAKIDTLATAAGFSKNPADIIPIVNCENEIEKLQIDIQNKKEIIKTLEEYYDNAKTELKTVEDIHERFFETEIKGDIDKLRQKNEILIQYLSTINSNDFLLNKLNESIENRQSEIFVQLKGTVDKARVVNEQYQKLKALQNDCCQLRQQTGQ